jgi:arylformamidase
MTAQIHIDGSEYRADLSAGHSIAIPMLFDGAQPNSYGVPRATAAAVEAGSFIGDTRRGGSCNFERVTLIPHCNGTHTECVGHIALDRISVLDLLAPALSPALLISVHPEQAAATAERYDPPATEEDALLTADGIRAALEAVGVPLRSRDGDRESMELPLPSMVGDRAVAEHREVVDDRPAHPFLEALVIRTLPNDAGKCARFYMETPAPFFSLEAMELLRVLGVRHLLVDIPSLDKAFDDGRMSAHRLFWDVAPGSLEVDPRTTAPRSVTEMIFVPDDIPDGRYLLDIQIAPFVSDAAPSRPVLFPLFPKHAST